MEWFITGGGGFIGNNLIRSLLNEGGHRIIVLDDKKMGTFDGVVHYSKSIMDLKTLIELTEWTDVIVHLAASTGVMPSVTNPIHDAKINILGTINILEAMRINGISRIVFASSSTVPGLNDPPYNETMFPRPISPYGASKAACEGYLHAYHDMYGMDTICLRFSNVYGPYSAGKSRQLIPRTINCFMNKEILEVFDDGEQTRDFCFVSDLVTAIRTAAVANGLGGEVFQIATGQETSVNKIISLIRYHMINYYGYSDIVMKYFTPRPGEVRRNFSNVRKASNKLFWYPRVPIEIGLVRTIEWFVNNEDNI